MTERPAPPVPPGVGGTLGFEHDVVVGHERRAVLEHGERGLDLELEGAERRALLEELDPRRGDVFERIGVVHDPGRARCGDPPRRERGFAALQGEDFDPADAVETGECVFGLLADDCDDGSGVHRVRHVRSYGETPRDPWIPGRSVRRASVAGAAGSRRADQYQPTDSEWLQAPQGVP